MTHPPTQGRTSPPRVFPFVAFFLALLILAADAFSQSPAGADSVERGRFILYKYQLPMGEEVYELKAEGDSLVLDTKFELTFVGDKVPLAARLRMTRGLAPRHFTVKGRTSTRTEVDRTIDVEGGRATIREGGRTLTRDARALLHDRRARPSRPADDALPLLEEDGRRRAPAASARRRRVNQVARPRQG